MAPLPVHVPPALAARIVQHVVPAARRRPHRPRCFLRPVRDGPARHTRGQAACGAAMVSYLRAAPPSLPSHFPAVCCTLACRRQKWWLDVVSFPKLWTLRWLSVCLPLDTRGFILVCFITDKCCPSARPERDVYFGWLLKLVAKTISTILPLDMSISRVASQLLAYVTSLRPPSCNIPSAAPLSVNPCLSRVAFPLWWLFYRPLDGNYPV